MAADGSVFVFQVSPAASSVAVLDPSYRQVATVPGTPVENAARDVPFDSPSGGAFLGERLVVANQAFASGERDHMVLLDVFVGQGGQEPHRPDLAALADPSPVVPEAPAAALLVLLGVGAAAAAGAVARRRATLPLSR